MLANQRALTVDVHCRIGSSEINGKAVSEGLGFTATQAAQKQLS